MSVLWGNPKYTPGGRPVVVRQAASVRNIVAFTFRFKRPFFVFFLHSPATWILPREKPSDLFHPLDASTIFSAISTKEPATTSTSPNISWMGSTSQTEHQAALNLCMPACQ